MTEGQPASGSANARPDAITLSFIIADLAATATRLAMLIRFAADEQAHFVRHKGAGGDIILARWAQANTLIAGALTEFEHAQARLDAASRHILLAVGDADDRSEQTADRLT